MDQKAIAVIQVRETEDLNSALAECKREEVDRHKNVMHLQIGRV